MATKLWAMLCVLFTTLLTASAQILYTLGSARLQFNLAGILGNYYILAGIFLYAIGGILMLISLRGGEVSVLYPIVATGYIWVGLMSSFFLNEKMNLFRWIGVILIIGGIAFIGYGSITKNKKIPAKAEIFLF